MPAPAANPKRPSPPPPPARRKAHALDDKRPAWKAGLIGTAAAHVILALVLISMPKDLLQVDHVASAPKPDRSFEIELSPDLFATPAPPAMPPRFVEVNPSAPENVPDKAPFVGAQNQQTAQPVPTPDGASNTPKVEGDGKEDSTALVSGLLKQPEAPLPSELFEKAFKPERPEGEPEPNRPEGSTARAVAPPVGGEQVLGKADGGIGSTVTKLPPPPGAERGAEAKEGSASGKATTGGYFSGMPKIDRTRPQERPRLTGAQVGRALASTIRNEQGTSNVGTLAYDAKWSSYAEYVQEVSDVISESLIITFRNTKIEVTPGAQVVVRFRIDSEGNVSEIVSVKGSARETVQRLVVGAITNPAPFRKWTDDMKATLGGAHPFQLTLDF